ncbi:MAG: D-aminoacyl-tRNA deacylase [Candidatus Hodarchaeales archaeon]|jgi:D-aminoacyl-tRNA deacylase
MINNIKSSSSIKGAFKWNNVKIALVASTKDQAALTIAKVLKEEKQRKVAFLKDKSALFITLDDLPKADCYIVLSKHSSSSKQKSFTVHSTGNFGLEAKVGGNPQNLGYSQAQIQTFLLQCLSEVYKKQSGLENFHVVAEATHHGPLIQKPMIFIEIGSSKNQWINENAGRVIAETIERFFSEKTKDLIFQLPIAIGIGGTHYAQKFSKKMIENTYAIGHICPKYAIASLNEELVDQMIERTFPRPSIALFDRKGMKRKSEIREWVEKRELEVIQI